VSHRPSINRRDPRTGLDRYCNPCCESHWAAPGSSGVVAHLSETVSYKSRLPCSLGELLGTEKNLVYLCAKKKKGYYK